MNLKVLHLTHTDINKDPRIIKSIKAIDKLSWIEVYGIGIQDSSHYSRTVSYTHLRAHETV